MQVLHDLIEKETGYRLESTDKIYNSGYHRKLKIWIIVFIVLLIAILFLPWTQNIRASGAVTTLHQEQRPQQLNAIIPGRIVKWYVKEGDYVKKGDTLIMLANVKDDYLDPNLVARTQEQLNSKQQKIDFYGDKVTATGGQITAMEATRELKISSLRNKIEQLRRKVVSDSAEWAAAVIDKNIATEQFERAKSMHSEGIISLVDFEKRTGSYQKALAAETEKLNKYQNTQQDLVIAKIDINSVLQETTEKVLKARGEQASAQSEMAGTAAEVSKLQNQVTNYTIRGSQLWLIAPQDGQVVNAVKAGLNEIVKEGEMIVQVIPSKVDYAVEIFVKPNDLVLVDTGQKVRFIFDGFPAVVFSGWPEASYGSFGGKIIAVESNRSENGLFRLLVVEDKDDRPWPKDLKMGTGANGFALLKDVPVWYELWRNINGFPANYYKDTKPGKGTKEAKKSKEA
ncbi:HlyD family secretion protein [Segetibacter aerophilus]|uniref:Biotin attachment protein n=1 Tax=Segetibacter aerophilus TaxID=670293 RepID=A0A512BJP0_9BACT|nr:HlyD family efflux transporter periplasmic adaptor subunit [Segetibacter aerophilus]GEO12176.1 biotin attachment protein [Segetibacter aerophilus]